MTVDIHIPDGLRRKIELQSAGRNTVLYDIYGNPSVMVVVPKVRLEDLGPDFGSGTHPAFICGGVEHDVLFVGKYLTSLSAGVAVSWPNRDPAAYVRFDSALHLAARKGSGWHMMTNAEWALMALQCWTQGIQPRGNTDSGAAHDFPDEQGELASADGAGARRKTRTGTGPDFWNHDNTRFGISDMVGNVWEWTAGLRLCESELQFVPDNDAALGLSNAGLGSPSWRSMQPDGTFGAPGEEGSIKLDPVQPGSSGDLGWMRLSQGTDNFDLRDAEGDAYGAGPFGALVADLPGFVPAKLKSLAVYPVTPDIASQSDGLWARPTGMRPALRGGDCEHRMATGMFCLNFNYAPDHHGDHIGFRLAYLG